MTALELWTRAAIAVLIVGSLAVFIWFVRDLVRMGRAWRVDGDDGAGSSPGEEP